MMRMKDQRAGLARRLGLAAATLFLIAGASGRPASAMSPVSPGAGPSTQTSRDALTIQVRGGHGGGGGGHHGGGGGGFRGGGGFHGGGGGFHGGGGGFHAAPAFHGGGGMFRGGGGPAFHGGGGHAFGGGGPRPVFHGGGPRPAFYGGGYHHRPHYAYRPYFHHHRRHFYGYRSYYTPTYTTGYYYPYRRCRIVYTYYGPRRICHYRHWRGHHWRHHHRWHHRHHRHHWRYY